MQQAQRFSAKSAALPTCTRVSPNALALLIFLDNIPLVRLAILRQIVNHPNLLFMDSPRHN